MPRSRFDVRAANRTLRWLSITPFGWPVVPEVYINARDLSGGISLDRFQLGELVQGADTDFGEGPDPAPLGRETGGMIGRLLRNVGSQENPPRTAVSADLIELARGQGAG